ncbi:MAG TPA: carbon-nitrogen hydrolase family protein [Solirubrobacterales bacterium]|nr:carbon-nitrogen hydrolase family protein [Solirubrobacterales bacterium]
MRAAAIQLNSSDDVDRNLEVAERLVAAAASAGAELVALPEKWPALASGEVLRELAEPLDGAIVSACRDWAGDHGIFLLAGSFSERRDDGEVANTSVLFDRDGGIAAVYRKIHMFDVDVGGVSYRESEHERAGEEIVLADAGELRLGLTVCYDLRFPELYRILALRGATAVTVPAAFTATTGRDHWEVLLRARAIEDQVFVVAPNQFGTAAPEYSSWGHSAIVDPWGRVLDLLADGEGHAIAELDLAELERVRAQVPSLASRRAAAYRWPVEVGDRG